MSEANFFLWYITPEFSQGGVISPTLNLQPKGPDNPNQLGQGRAFAMHQGALSDGSTTFPTPKY